MTSASPRRTTQSPRTPRILIVEDDASFRHMLRVMLSRFNYEIVDAGTGIEALFWLNQYDDFAAVLTDIAMPELDGIELTAMIHSRYPDVPIIVISSYAHLANQALLRGARVSLAKPFTINELRTTLVNAIQPPAP